MTAPARIRLTIDRLALVGVSPGDAAAVRRALTSALEARLAEADASALVGNQATLALSVAPGPGPAALGRAAGSALAGRLTGGAR